MELLTTKKFNDVVFDCYKADNEGDGFWATREQIGQLLEYSNPRDAIAKIHARNKERLDQFSRVDNLSTEAGIRSTVVYNFKGFLEICRFSNQLKANAVIDFAWNVMDEIRKTGSYLSTKPSYEYEDSIERAKVWIKEEEKRRALAAENRIMKPKAVYFDALVERNMLTNFRDTAKELHVPEKDFITYCLEHKLLYRDQKGKLKPYSEYVKDGWFELKDVKGIHNSWAGIQVLVTVKGKESIRLMLEVDNYERTIMLG